MKALFKILPILLAFAFASCKVINEGQKHKDDFVEAGKTIALAWGKDKLKQFFPEANLERDSIYLKGKFSRNVARQIVTEGISKELTDDGDIRYNTRKRLISIDWTRVEGTDSTWIEIVYVNKEARAARKAFLNTPMKPLHEAIQTELATIVGNDAQPVIKQVDRWSGQVASMEQSSPLILPAVFIEFGTVQWKKARKRNVSEGEVNVRLYVVQENYADTQHGAAQQPLALANTYDLHNEIYKKMDGFAGNTFSPFVRSNTEFDSNPSNVITDVIAYKTVFTDTTKLDAIYSLTVNPSLEVQKQN